MDGLSRNLKFRSKSNRPRLALRARYGGFVAVIPALVMDYFGSRHISGIM
jgi:hypothetical protein